MSLGHDPHSHPQKADSKDETYSHEQLMTAALEKLLIDKALISSGDMSGALDYWASKTPADGATLVTRYWTDPDFAQRVLRKSKQRCRRTRYRHRLDTRSRRR